MLFNKIFTNLLNICLLLAAESVNLFVKVGLVFATIDHFPLKASLVALSKLVKILLKSTEELKNMPQRT